MIVAARCYSSQVLQILLNQFPVFQLLLTKLCIVDWYHTCTSQFGLVQVLQLLSRYLKILLLYLRADKRWVGPTLSWWRSKTYSSALLNASFLLNLGFDFGLLLLLAAVVITVRLIDTRSNFRLHIKVKRCVQLSFLNSARKPRSVTEYFFAEVFAFVSRGKVVYEFDRLWHFSRLEFLCAR